ncbi:hypothetical protein Y1Q_0015106 [Alligator mississippiensis]|uniref:Uncharacterized protein n=1 Tax=Alligator mississippiensis TaxID=8496 RepID=A0A151P958_ALLMI|nr:hypothetical protein Y1Q_0015106 [Alligator mississippiensis]
MQLAHWLGSIAIHCPVDEVRFTFIATKREVFGNCGLVLVPASKNFFPRDALTTLSGKSEKLSKHSKTIYEFILKLITLLFLGMCLNRKKEEIAEKSAIQFQYRRTAGCFHNGPVLENSN